MHKVLAIVRRELIAYFSSPLAYIVLTAFLLMQGCIFYLVVAFANEPGGPPNAPLHFFFGGFFFWLFLLFVVPAITMRLVAEERRSGTIEVLLTSPLSEGQVIAGKFVAALLFYLFLWLPTLVYVLILATYGEVDPGPVAAGYLGVALLGFLFLAVGVLMSTLSKNQLVAAILAFAALLFLFIVVIFDDPRFGSTIQAVASHMNVVDHMDSFKLGIVDTRHVVYFLSTGTFFLYLATKALEVKKWR